MNQPRDIERLLDHWFADGSSVAPDRTIDIVADRIERQPQRPAWRLDWRHLSMNPLAKAGAAIAAVVLIALVGYNLLPAGSNGVGAPAPSVSPSVIPSPTPTATPSPSQAVQPLPDSLLTAGTYSMAHIDGMTINATVPDGWRGIPGFGLAGPSNYDAPLGLSIVFLEVNGAYDDPCHWDKDGTGNLTQRGEQVVGPTVDDLVADIRANTSYTSTAPTDVTIDGHSGKQLNLQLPSAPDFASCDRETGSTTGNYFPLIGGIYALGPGNIWHTRIIDVDGSRLVVLVADYAGTPADVQGDAKTIIDSIKFAKS